MEHILVVFLSEIKIYVRGIVWGMRSDFLVRVLLSC